MGFSEHRWAGQKHPKMFKFPSLVISDQFLMGHISQILKFSEFFACFLMELFQEFYTEYFSEAILKHKKLGNWASFTCIPQGWVKKRKVQNIRINYVNDLLAKHMFDTIFISFCSALKSESVYMAHWTYSYCCVSDFTQREFWSIVSHECSKRQKRSNNCFKKWHRLYFIS